jgi:hypothetical protein
MTDFKNPWAKGGKYYPNWIEETKRKVLDTSKLFGNEDESNSSQTTKSKYRVLLFGGVDYFNEGAYGTNKQLAQYIETIALSSKYKIPLQKGDIQVVNSPLFSNEVDGKDVYKEILEIVKKNFDYNNGTLILYGYSWGGQLLMEFLKFFKQSGIKISLLLSVDAAKGYFSFAVNNDVTNNVKYNLNLYQTNFLAGLFWSRGGPNEGNKVKNVDLTGEKNPKGEDVVHSNIDEYTLIYSAQVIIYALKNIYTFYDYSEAEIKSQIKTYASQGY